MPYFDPLLSRISGGAQTDVGKRKGNLCTVIQHLFRADVSVFRALNVNKNCNAWRGTSNAINQFGYLLCRLVRAVDSQNICTCIC